MNLRSEMEKGKVRKLCSKTNEISKSLSKVNEVSGTNKTKNKTHPWNHYIRQQVKEEP